MRTRIVAALAAVAGCSSGGAGAGGGSAGATTQPQGGPPVAIVAPPAGGGGTGVGNGNLAGPFVHGNLVVYLVRGTGPADPREFLTLDEGAASGEVVVTERGGQERPAGAEEVPADPVEEEVLVEEGGNANARVQVAQIRRPRRGGDSATVNTLEISNLSSRWVYVEAGEVVKGGKQDRTLGRDLLLAPGQKNVPIAAFCVEHGRWTPRSRGTVAVAGGAVRAEVAFGSAEACCSPKAKIAILKEKNQQRVWDYVAKDRAQNAAEETASGTFVDVAESRSVKDRVAPYLAALGDLPSREPGAVGAVFAVGGEVVAADVYIHPALFRKLYPKLLAAHAREAALASAGPACVVPEAEAACAFLSAADDGTIAEEPVAAGQSLATRENARTIAFEARENGACLHKTVLKK
ncbi:MAG: hypothetical protein L0216_16725 [Planctomycetales bacterium]|nr:hypothetical protein [Planctomycetales bacterium]